MAYYGSNQIAITCTDSGGTPRTMSNYIREFNGITKEAIINESHAFGDAWFEALATGVKRADDLVWGGHYNDAATTGPDVVFNAIGDTRNIVVTWGSTKTTTFDAIITKYARLPVVNDLTRFQVTLKPTGALSEA